MVFNTERFAKRVREKRGTRSLRDVAAELQLGFATLSRIERGKMPDLYNFGLLCQWLGDNPAVYFEVDSKSDDAMSVQLRAAQTMSADTARAFIDIIRAAYAQALDQAGDADRA